MIYQEMTTARDRQEHRSDSISNSIPKEEHWLKALAAIPSKQSKS
jgi:hypothetical protein